MTISTRKNFLILMLAGLLLPNVAAANTLICREFANAEMFEKSDGVIRANVIAIDSSQRDKFNGQYDQASIEIKEFWKLKTDTIPEHILVSVPKENLMQQIHQGNQYILFLGWDALLQQYALKTCSPRIPVTHEVETIFFLLNKESTHVD